MSKRYLLTFVIPAYNSQDFIKLPIQSLLAQTEKNFEIIVVDDGSTDNTFLVARSMLSQSGFRNYKVLRKRNEGVSSARNFGLRHSSGELVVFLDADDYVDENLVRNLRDVVLRSEESTDIVFWKYCDVNESGLTVGGPNYPYELSGSFTFSGKEIMKIFLESKYQLFAIDAVAFARNFLLRECLLFDESHKYGEDQEFIYRSLLRARIVRFVPNNTTYRLKHPLSATRKPTLRHFDAYHSLRAVVQEIETQDQEMMEPIRFLLNKRAVFAFLSAMMRTSVNFKTYEAFLTSLSCEYPEIFNEVVCLARSLSFSCSAGGILKQLALEIFKISPRLYFHLAKLFWKFKMNVSKFKATLRRSVSESIFRFKYPA